jgi:transcriptional regulator with XRE-family HTH domain
MNGVGFDEVWDELKNNDEESKLIFGTAEEVSRIIVELIDARVEKGYSQRDLAAVCGIKQSAIARMESLKTIPRLDTVVRVANALGVKIVLSSDKPGKKQARVEKLSSCDEAQEM